MTTRTDRSKYYYDVDKNMLTRSRKNFSRLFNWETPAPASDYDQIYTADNFSGWFPKQVFVMEKTSSVDIPIYAEQYPNSPAYRYARCSYKKMMSMGLVSIYALMPESTPLHFFIDFDIPIVANTPEEDTRYVSDAIEEALACLTIIFRAEIDAHNPSFERYNGDFTIELLYGHKKTKQSAHLIVHTSNLSMIKGMSHCKSMYSRIVIENLKRHPDKSKNPLYYKHGDTYKCIADEQVYTPNRVFRLPGMVKNDGKFAGVLTPDCGSDKLVCDSPSCNYHVKRQMDVSDYCANDTRFVPRTSSGVPMIVDLLEFPETSNPNLRKNAGLNLSINQRSISGFLGADSNSMILAPRGDNSVSPFMSSNSRGFSAMLVDQTQSMQNMRTQIMQTLASLISRATRSKCTFVSFNPGSTEIGLFASDSNACPYKYRNANRSTTGFSSDYSTARMINHVSNHVGFVAKIFLPPKIHLICTDDVCMEYVASLKVGFALQLMPGRVTLDVTETDDELYNTYRRLVLLYMRKTDLPLALFKM